MFLCLANTSHHHHHHKPYPGGCCTGEACLTAADDPAAPLNQAGRLVFAHAAPNCWAGLPMVSDPQPDAHWGHWLLANAPDRCMSVGGPSFAVGPLMTATAPTRCVQGVGSVWDLGGGHNDHYGQPTLTKAIITIVRLLTQGASACGRRA